jgi:hypothetical protein
MIDRILKRLGLRDAFGYDDPSIFGFIVIWTAFGYGFVITFLAILDRIFG